MEACELGRARFDLRAGGEVTSGGSGEAFGLEDGEETVDGEPPGGVSSGDMTAAILDGLRLIGAR